MDAIPATHEAIIERANRDPSFRLGLAAAALVCRSQGRTTSGPCPSTIAAAYLDSLANGEMP